MNSTPGPAAQASSSSSFGAANNNNQTEGYSIETRQAPDQEQEQQQRQQVNLQAHLSGRPTESEASSRSSSAAAGSTLADRSFGTSAGALAATTSSSSSSSSRQINREAPAAVATTSHRIKVTLSLPRSSTNGEPTSQAADTTGNSSNGAGQHDKQQAASFDPKRRQSTATLISAAESFSSSLQQQRRPTQTSQSGATSTAPLGASISSFALAQSASSSLLDGSHPAAVAGAVLTGPNRPAPAPNTTASAAITVTAGAAAAVDRAAQERELRRIASQRVTRAAAGPAGEQPPEPPQPAPTATVAAPVSSVKQKPQQEQQQLDVLVPNHKQLAIYINGKIRSDSIFCQSSSLSDSFHSIFNRFHPSNEQDKQRQQHQDSTGQREQQQQQQQQQQRQQQGAASASKRLHSGARRNRNNKRSRKNGPDKAAAHDASLSGKQGPQLRLRVRELIGKYLPSNSSTNNNRPPPSTDRRPNSTESAPSSENHNVDNDAYQSESALIEKKQKDSTATATTTTTTTTTTTSQQPVTTTASYKLNPSSMFLRKAMRYYRLWIYCTNVTILLGTLLFIIAVLYVASDYRLPLIISSSSASSLSDDDDDVINDDDRDGIGATNQDDDEESTIFTTTTGKSFPIKFTEPSMLFAYVAVAIQAGILQLIGCFGAVRMKEKFIQLFWYTILALTVLDIVFLVYWLLRYDLMVKSLNEHMKFRLNEHFGTFAVAATASVEEDDDDKLYFPSPPDSLKLESTGDNYPGSDHYNIRGLQQNKIFTTKESIKFDKIFTNIINRIQRESRCCGIASPLDYRRTKWRQVKLKQLENTLNWTTAQAESADISAQQRFALLSRVPLVAGSCCRRNDHHHQRQHHHRQQQQQQQHREKERRPVILDDSEMPAKVRVPAWAPSSVTEDLQDSRSQQHRGRLKLDGGEGQTKSDRLRDRERPAEDGPAKSLADIIDERWTSSPSNGRSSKPASGGDASNDNEDVALLIERSGYHEEKEEAEAGAAIDEPSDKELDRGLSKQQRRLLAKQDNYKLPAAEDRSSRERRWTVESTIDGQERVLSRLIEGDDDAADDESQPDELDIPAAAAQPPDDDYNGADEELLPAARIGMNERGNNLDDDDEDDAGNSLGENEVTPMSKLASLRRALFQWKRPSISSFGSSNDHHDNSGRRKENDTSSSGRQWLEDTFRWPNKLQLNYRQYKTLESYLLAEEETRLSAAAKLARAGENGHQQAEREQRPRRSIFSSLIGAGAGPSSELSSTTTTAATPPGEQSKQSAAADARQRAVEQLRSALESDGELGCAPRSHFDNATIYTRGCHEPIRAWLDRSGHILFVTGFCVLSMLKLFSLLLLRLELREMIHKIRVLKGMATEYNALHDLEAYLPRPSVCAQAAELTPSGVAAAILPAASVTPVASSASGGAVQPAGRICGGSFSEAVVAATAAAAAANIPQQLSAGSGPCRASSMKTVTTMLTPAMCPRSSSVSAAHLQAALQQRCFTGSASLRSDLFHQSGPMSRRHTAVSVCPAAAAAAAAAAHHLMSRRGTYVPSAFPLVSPSLGFSLSQHRHSAHTVHTLPSCGNNSMMMMLNPSSSARQQQQQQQQRRPSSTSSAHQQQQQPSAHHHRTSLAVSARHYLGDMARARSATNPSDESGGQQSSMDSNHSGGRCFFPSAVSACHQPGTPSADDLAQQQQQHQQQQQQQQQLLLHPTFKRQSSSGAQSACNFSLDPRPAASLLAESRRSIH